MGSMTIPNWLLVMLVCLALLSILTSLIAISYALKTVSFLGHVQDQVQKFSESTLRFVNVQSEFNKNQVGINDQLCKHAECQRTINDGLSFFLVRNSKKNG